MIVSVTIVSLTLDFYLKQNTCFCMWSIDGMSLKHIPTKTHSEIPKCYSSLLPYREGTDRVMHNR